MKFAASCCFLRVAVSFSSPNWQGRYIIPADASLLHARHLPSSYPPGVVVNWLPWNNYATPTLPCKK